MRYLVVCLYVLMASGLCWTCKPQDCLKSNGRIDRQAKSVAYFYRIIVEDNITLVLKAGNGIEIETGSHLIEGISLEVSGDSTLRIRNKNICSWARNYDVRVRVYVGTDHLEAILWKSYGNLITEQTTPISSLKIDCFGTNSLVNLDIEASYGVFLFSNTGTDIRLRGRAPIFSVYNLGYGRIDASNFLVEQVAVRQNGQNNILVNAVLTLTGTIESNGNIIYLQEPAQKSVLITGTGKLYRK